MLCLCARAPSSLVVCVWLPPLSLWVILLHQQVFRHRGTVTRRTCQPHNELCESLIHQNFFFSFILALLLLRNWSALTRQLLCYCDESHYASEWLSCALQVFVLTPQVIITSWTNRPTDEGEGRGWTDEWIRMMVCLELRTGNNVFFKFNTKIYIFGIDIAIVKLSKTLQ